MRYFDNQAVQADITTPRREGMVPNRTVGATLLALEAIMLRTFAPTSIMILISFVIQVTIESYAASGSIVPPLLLWCQMVFILIIPLSIIFTVAFGERDE